MPDGVLDRSGSILMSLAETMRPDGVVEDLCIGLFVTAIRTSEGTGIATTFYDRSFDSSLPMVTLAGKMEGMRVSDLIRRAVDGSALERSIAVAAVNASSRERPFVSREGNGFELLVRHGEGKRVVFIGHFPFVDSDRARSFASLQVFELPYRMKPGDRGADELPEHLREADIVAITGTALVTQTLESILDLCPPSCLRMMVGMTTPMARLLFERGIDILCGTEVVDPPTVMRGAAQGATHRQLEGVRKVVCIRPSLEL